MKTHTKEKDFKPRIEQKPTVRVFEKLMCSVKGCDGYMEAREGSSDTFHSYFDHVCQICGHVEVIQDGKFPRYRDIIIEDDA